MRMLEIVQKAMILFHGSFINHNNELILIPKFNVYMPLNNVHTDVDFKAKLCGSFSRDCCCALRYSQQKRLEKYWQENTDKFNILCGTNFTVAQMNYIYSYLGNGIKPELARQFIRSGFSLYVIYEYEHKEQMREENNNGNSNR